MTVLALDQRVRRRRVLLILAVLIIVLAMVFLVHALVMPTHSMNPACAQCSTIQMLVPGLMSALAALAIWIGGTLAAWRSTPVDIRHIPMPTMHPPDAGSVILR